MRNKNRIRRSKGDKAVVVFAYCFVGLIALLCLIPLLMVVGVSFSDNTDVLHHGYRIIPEHFSLDNYIYLFAHSGKAILRSYGVTIFVTVVGTLGATFITSMAAFALSIKSLKYRNKLAFFFNFTLIFSAGLVPWYYVCHRWYHMSNSIWGLIIPSIMNVYNMFLMRSYFNSVPVSLYEAARIDGASYFKIYRTIAVPLSKTAMLTVGMMYALCYWNDWWNALMFINDRSKFPLQYYLYNILSNVNAISSGRIPSGAAANIVLPSETLKMAVTLVTIGPILFLYPFIQRYFVNGVMAGAVKE